MNLVVQGREAYAYTGGKPFDPALPCVVFVHGAMGDHGKFTLLARWFAHHGWSVLAPDLPGHMRSAGPALTSVACLTPAASRRATTQSAIASMLASGGPSDRPCAGRSIARTPWPWCAR